MKQYLTLRFMFAIWLTSLLMKALAGIEAQAQTQIASRPSQIVIATTPSSGAVTVQLTIPADVQLDSLSIKLNGNESSRSFTTVNCPQAVCQQATFTSPDGLHDSKNVLSVIAKRNDGTLVSTRTRFVGTAVTADARTAVAGPRAVHANAISALPTLNSFLPPAVAFTTLVAGGYNGSPWIQVGSQNTYPANPASYTCTGLYTVIVLDRQTLQEKTSAPESSPNCVSDGAGLNTYLGTLNASDLVIVGSNYGVNSDAGSGHGQLNTAAIGGSAYNCLSASDCSSLPSTTVTSVNVPLGYMAIGVGGAASGSAFENYYGQNYNWVLVNPHATGMLVEDSNGNYNFQPSTAIEYTVVPNDPNNSGVSTITVGSVPGDPYYTKNLTSKLYTPPGGTGQNGMWMLILQRSTLYSVPFNVAGTPPPVMNQDACTQTGTNGTVAVFYGCGVFYDTGDSNPTNATNAYNNLMADLSNASNDPTELVFLVSIGNQPGYPDTNGVKLIPVGLATAFSLMGGTPETLTSLSTPGSTYSYVGCSGCGNSLGGNVVISTNLQSQQGQSGYIHGLLEPNLNGIYWPTQASLDQPASAAQPTTDFTIQEVTSTPPVEWPELSNTQKLAVTTSSGTTYTADTTGGQNAAYYYIGYQLINQYYIIGAQGSYIDDIHYYFTGGSNTFLDYHTYDPANLVYPGTSCYQWTDPVPGRGTLACFTQNDFNAVRAQMHNEIVYLTNVLQYMVNGSTNMKDIVASGGGSAALALINAAASVQASTLQPPPATPVKASVSNILNFVGNLVSVGASIGLGVGGIEGTEAIKAAISKYGSFAGVISGAFGMASAATGSGGLGSGSNGSAPLPSKNYTFLTTIGNLSNNSLQQSITAGFDTGLDTIVGDWYKLSTIGPKITDSNNPAFQPATQTASLIGILQIGQASQRTFYTALLPVDYSVQHYSSWFGQFGKTNYPDMGARTDDAASYCNTWYFKEPAPSTINLVSKSYFSYSGETRPKWGFYDQNLQEVPNPTPIDWFVLASSATPANPGKSTQQIQLLDTQTATTLFSASQLNIPMDAFLDQNGPMASVWWDSGSVGFDHFSADQTCSFYVAGAYGSSQNTVGLAPPGPNAVHVALNVPATGVLGDNIALKATAAVAGSPLTSGVISFDEGNTNLGQATLDKTGTAILTINTLALGAHSINASFVASTQYTASSPVTAALVIYANDVDLTLTPSTGSLSVTSGSTSSPLSLQVTSKWGLAGLVTFACSGLPVGSTCNFAPAQVTLTDGTSATTSLTITSVKQTAKLSSTTGALAAMLLPLPLLLLRRRYRSIQLLCAIVIVSVASLGILTGCSGGPSAPVTQPNSSTVLVTATSGTISRSIPINVTVQ
jgi:hypothetical protein